MFSVTNIFYTNNKIMESLSLLAMTFLEYKKIIFLFHRGKYYY